MTQCAARGAAFLLTLSSPRGLLPGRTIPAREPPPVRPAGSDNRPRHPGPGPGRHPSRLLVVLKQICDPLVAFDQVHRGAQAGDRRSRGRSPTTARPSSFRSERESSSRTGGSWWPRTSSTRSCAWPTPKPNRPMHYLLAKVAGYANVRSGIDPLLVGSNRARRQHPADPAFGAVRRVSRSDGAPGRRSRGGPGGGGRNRPNGTAPKPVCTGPYKVERKRRRVDRDRSDLAATTPPTGRSRAGGPATPTASTFGIVPNLGRPTSGSDGETPTSPRSPPSDLPKASDERAEVESGQSGHVTYIGFPTDKSPFDTAAAPPAGGGRGRPEVDIKDLLGGSRAEADRAAAAPAAGPPPRQSACPPAANAGDDVRSRRPDSVLQRRGRARGVAATVVDDWEAKLHTRTTLKTMDWSEYVDFLACRAPTGPSGSPGR